MGGFEGIGSLLLIVVMFVALYFFMIRPQKKQEKEQNDMRNNLQVGDEITTIGGIIGKIVSIKEETVTIETSHDRTKIRILRSAVRNVDVKAEDAQDWFLITLTKSALLLKQWRQSAFYYLFFVYKIFLRYSPVYDSLTVATSSGVPFATIFPPLSPPSGPGSII